MTVNGFCQWLGLDVLLRLLHYDILQEKSVLWIFVFNIILSIGTKSNRLLFSENDAIAYLDINYVIADIVILGVLCASHNSNITNISQA